MGENKDRQMLEKCISEDAIAVFENAKCDEYPLDTDIVKILRSLYEKIDKDSDDFYIFKFRKNIIDPLWKELIEKAIKCLRYCDEREPFRSAEEKGERKTPKAYGIITVSERQDVIILIKRLYEQSLDYVTIFRDGQDTGSRNFSFIRKLLIKCGEIQVDLKLNILKDSASELMGKIQYTSDDSIKKDFGLSFFQEISVDFQKGVRFCNREGKECGNIKINKNGNVNDLKNYSDCVSGEFSISLAK